jgi:hypothetical protein
MADGGDVTVDAVIDALDGQRVALRDGPVALARATADACRRIGSLNCANKRS